MLSLVKILSASEATTKVTILPTFATSIVHSDISVLVHHARALSRSSRSPDLLLEVSSSSSTSNPGAVRSTGEANTIPLLNHESDSSESNDKKSS